MADDQIVTLTLVVVCHYTDINNAQSQNSHKPVLIFWSSIPCVFCMYTLLKVNGYYDLSVCPCQ